MSNERAVLHTTGPKCHYVKYLQDNRLVGPHPTKREALAAVARANAEK